MWLGDELFARGLRRGTLLSDIIAVQVNRHSSGHQDVRLEVLLAFCLGFLLRGSSRHGATSKDILDLVRWRMGWGFRRPNFLSDHATYCVLNVEKSDPFRDSLESSPAILAALATLARTSPTLASTLFSFVKLRIRDRT